MIFATPDYVLRISLHMRLLNVLDCLKLKNPRTHTVPDYY